MKKKLILFIILLCFFIIILTNTTSAFASTTTSNEIGTLNIEKDVFEISYKTNQMMKIYGTVTNPQSGGKVTIVLTMPDGNQDGLQIFIADGGYFETYFTLDDKSQKGTYELFASYNSKIIGSLSFIVKENTNAKQPPTNINQKISKRSSLAISIVLGSSVPDCYEAKSCFDPSNISVDVGDEVIWYNDDTATHTVTSGDIQGDGPDGVFDSSLIGPGKTFSYKFEDARTFKYFCMVHPWATGIVFVSSPSSVSINPITPNIITQSKPSVTYVSTQLSLDVRDSSNPKHIQVYPALTYGSGKTLFSKNIRIYVDNMDKGTVNSNQWSGDIWVGFGTHKIKATIQDSPDRNDNSVIYLGSGFSGTHFVNQPTVSNPISITNQNSDGTNAALIAYVIIGIAVAAVIGIAIGLSKRKKILPLQSPYIRSPSQSDDTQFYGCPTCHGDTQLYYGKQYCPKCKVYL